MPPRLPLALLALLTAPLIAAPPAFPGAEGFGAVATGGRGGEVAHVTNLNDAGPGSLRDALGRGHRTVVFDVGGYVELKSILRIPSDVTIAGQTAPGEGIGTRGHEVSFSGSTNVICRYIRFRQGLAEKEDKKAAVAMHDAHRVILDHVSIQWGRWDTVDMTDASDVTLQYCIIGPGVAPQRFGCLCQSDNVTFSHNLWIGNQSRNPKSKGKVQFVNNVIYNWGKVGFVGGHSAGDHLVDIVNNCFIKGPSSSDTFAGEFAATDHVYQTGNLLFPDRTGKPTHRLIAPEEFRGATVVQSPWSPLPANLDSAEQAYHAVAASAGCSLHRDPVDARLIDDLTSLGLRGSTISDPAQMGGFAQIHSAPAQPDADADGIPDAWERDHHLNPNDPTDATYLDPTGYTMLEMYFNGLVTSARAK